MIICDHQINKTEKLTLPFFIEIRNKYFLNEMELNIVFQYVTLLDSHFNIELFKSERENTINLVIILQSKYFYNFIGDTMKT